MDPSWSSLQQFPTSGRRGFWAGTLVHTPDGLTPIELLRAGALVLSRGDSRGNHAYKRVVRTSRHMGEAVCRLHCFGEGGEFGSENLVLTGSHRVFVAGHHNNGAFSTAYWDKLHKPTGWMRADLLHGTELVELANGECLKVGMVDRIWQTRTPSVGWIEANPDSVSFGHFIDLRNGQVVEDYGVSATADLADNPEFVARNDDEEEQDRWSYKCDVFSFEVEEFHTYYVGRLGVWVHDSWSTGGDAP